MTESRDDIVDVRLREAYYDYLDELAEAGVIDHSLDIAILDGKTVEEAIVGILRAAGRLPEGWDDEAEQVTPLGEQGRRAS